jgi:hypothetical protein
MHLSSTTQEYSREKTEDRKEEIAARKESQISLLNHLLIRLHLIADLKVPPTIKAHTALGTLLHLRNIFLCVFERVEGAY